MDLSWTNFYERSLTLRARQMEKIRWRLSQHHERCCPESSCDRSRQYSRIYWNFDHHHGSSLTMPKSVEWLSGGEKEQISQILLFRRRRYAWDFGTVSESFHHSTSFEKIVLRHPYSQVYWWTGQNFSNAISFERRSQPHRRNIS